MSKIVVAGVNAEGRSFVESRREIDEDPPFWAWTETSFGDLATYIGRVPVEQVSPELEPPPGHFRWAYQVKQPKGRQTAGPAYDMHVTRTIDFDFVVKGRMHCVLDEETVELEAGDFIVLKAASHRWENPSETEETVILYLLHTPIDPSA
jgi:mannose-6-phosphate isomerase-like protein (cupin superfamily)